MFGKASQIEGKGKEGARTDLGTWSEAVKEEESALFVFKWRNGTKCWNGPQRSATLFVTCGIESKMLSADEPNICEYEFKMESFIACDDEFKKLHNIVDE